MRERIKNSLMVLEPLEIELLDDSDSHIGHAGHNGFGESHFNLMLVSKHFNGKSAVERHRMVNKLIKQEFNSSLHAISMKLISQEEFK